MQILQKALGTHLRTSTANHPQTDMQSEKMIQTLEDLLRSCALEFTESRDQHLGLIEFFYNNIYHSSIGVTPFEALYERPCTTPQYWMEHGVQALTVPDILHELDEKVKIIRNKLITS